MTRYNRSTADVVKQTAVGMTLGEFGIGLAGVLLSHAAASDNIVAIITSSVGVVGLVIVLTGTLKINDWNLYSASLGLVNFVSTTFRTNLNRVATTIVVGIVGSVIAAAGILGHFTDFLTTLGVAFPPIAGIMIAEYFVVKVWRKDLDATREAGELPANAPRVVPATIVIWLVASLIGKYVTWGIPSITSLVVAMVLYVVAGRAGLVRGVGVSRTPTAAAKLVPERVA
jgi:cytosine permease